MPDARPDVLTLLAQLPAGTLAQLVNLPPWFGILPQRMWDKDKRVMFASLKPPDVAPALTQTATFRADPNHDFVGYVATGKLRLNDALGTVKPDDPVVVKITGEDGTGFQPNNTVNDFVNLFGSAAQPAFWPFPIIVPAGQAVNFDFTNNHNGDTLTIRCTIWGLNVNVK